MRSWDIYSAPLAPKCRYTHVTLHHLMDTVDLKDAGVRTRASTGWLERWPRACSAVESVSVLMPGYRQILHEKYGRTNVHLRSHGVLTRRRSTRTLRGAAIPSTAFWRSESGELTNGSS